MSLNSMPSPPPNPVSNPLPYSGPTLNGFGRGQGRGRRYGSRPQCQLCGKFGHLVHNWYKRFDTTFIGVTTPSNKNSGSNNQILSIETCLPICPLPSRLCSLTCLITLILPSFHFLPPIFHPLPFLLVPSDI